MSSCKGPLRWPSALRIFRSMAPATVQPKVADLLRMDLEGSQLPQKCAAMKRQHRDTPTILVLHHLNHVWFHGCKVRVEFYMKPYIYKSVTWEPPKIIPKSSWCVTQSRYKKKLGEVFFRWSHWLTPLGESLRAQFGNQQIEGALSNKNKGYRHTPRGYNCCNHHQPWQTNFEASPYMPQSPCMPTLFQTKISVHISVSKRRPTLPKTMVDW